MRLSNIVFELSFVWLVYYLFGLATTYELPVWLTALLVLSVDRAVGLISRLAKTRRDGI